MKKAWKMAGAGVILGCVELGAAGLLAGVWKVGTFEDTAFLLGIATLVVGLFALFGVSRLRTGAMVSGSNANAQTAFASQVAFEEQSTLSKLPQSVKTKMASFSVGSLVFFVGAAVNFVGFGISLLF